MSISATLLVYTEHIKLRLLFMFTKNAKVKVLRKESYWYQDMGIVFKVEKSSIKYPISVRFTKESYNGVTSNNFSPNELMLVS